MKYLITVLAVLVSFAASADPRISQWRGSSCHFPKDAANTDHEDKVACPKSILIGNSYGGVVAGYAKVTSKVPCDFMPPDIVVQSDGASSYCLMINDDNDGQGTYDWVVNITGDSTEDQEGNRSCTVTHELICGTGADGLR